MQTCVNMLTNVNEQRDRKWKMGYAEKKRQLKKSGYKVKSVYAKKSGYV